ncbi:pseudoazurin [Nitratireductor indicus]|uniref:Pseudoazurin n=1 Tax=Nitratireductor indicus C115 TaxID=1231190 RepID=K2NMW2_9HYPH|nr:pseudoazurin [Nitratireductor indicus]EKF40775.1 pseudoazurin [Nitratireductor indicus C115]MDS1136393.1 pseudoazurin [Nitratireductor indicus]SFQ75552.1 pseudoazurin [Nitratireductor indicus]
MKTVRNALTAFAAAALLATALVPAGAAEFEVKMLNKGEKGAMVFEPEIVRAAPGDTVKFVPTDKGHNAESVEGMYPDGATPFKGVLNKEITVTFDKEGVYGIRCKPHYGLGMVMLVEVGSPVNAEAAKAAKAPKKAKIKFEELFAELDNQ